MDRLQSLEIFSAVAELGNFSKAANKLRVSAPAVTRAVAGLEERLGARLLNRTTRSLSLTEAGVHFLDSARRILADLDAAEKIAAGDAAIPTGHLTLTAPVTFGRMHGTPVLLEFLRAHPKVTASLRVLDRIVSYRGRHRCRHPYRRSAGLSAGRPGRRRGAAHLRGQPRLSRRARHTGIAVRSPAARYPGLSRRPSGAGMALPRRQAAMAVSIARGG
jgi:DNA-binding transcriptional LysR family regulator